MILIIGAWLGETGTDDPGQERWASRKILVLIRERAGLPVVGLGGAHREGTVGAGGRCPWENAKKNLWIMTAEGRQGQSPLRSVLVGAMVMLMGMAGGILLSLLLSASQQAPGPVAQGIISKAMPSVPEPQASVKQLKEPEPESPAPGSEDTQEALVEAVEGRRPEDGFPGGVQPPQVEPVREPLRDSDPRESPAPAFTGFKPSKETREATGPQLSPSQSGPRFIIHVESFKDPQTAARRVEALRARGLEAFTEPVDLPGRGRFHRVMVGRFQDRATALAFLEELKSRDLVKDGRVLNRSKERR